MRLALRADNGDGDHALLRGPVVPEGSRIAVQSVPRIGQTLASSFR